MKIAFKTLIYSLLFICLGTAAHAQLNVPDSVRISIGAEVSSTINAGFGTGVNTSSSSDATAAYNYGAGFSVGVDVPFMRDFYVTASGGYTSFFTTGKAINSQQAILGVTLPNFNIIPLKVGLKYLIGNRFYVQAEAGETLLANKAALYAVYSNSFTWSPGLGLVLPLKKHHTYIDGGLRYENTASFYNNNTHNAYWALHVSYAFNL